MYQCKRSAPGYKNPVLIDLSGKKFAAWTVISGPIRNATKQTCWTCRCDCGTERLVVAQPLRSGLTKSCGCLKGEFIAKALTKHGNAGGYVRVSTKRASETASNGGNRKVKLPKFNTARIRDDRDSLTYKRWNSMKSRVKDKSPSVFQYYGAKDIKVEPRWLTFANFLADMGPCPEGLTLDRINPDANYGPGNCRWATWSQQFRQRMMTEVCGTCHKLRQVCGADEVKMEPYYAREIAAGLKAVAENRPAKTSKRDAVLIQGAKDAAAAIFAMADELEMLRATRK